MPAAPFSAELAQDEARLRFPYDETLRQLLRAIPGRRWDPVERAWCLPLGPDQAQALALLLESLPGEPEISEQLAGAIRRRRAKRRREQCVIELARPDEDWWLSFATDLAPGPVERLLEHPGARELPEIARGLVPLDDDAVELIRELEPTTPGLSLSEAARRALAAQAERASAGPAPGAGEDDGARPAARGTGAHEVEFRRDRRGEHWILIAPARVALARVLAARAGLRALEGPGGSLGLAALE
ncbi:MAG TPA: hypothetical protein VF380_05650, partial [Solirubrobacteraceae bacterium]